MKIRRTGLVLLAILVCTVGQGCYNPKAVNEFLQEPRTPVAALDYRVFPPDVLLISSDNIREVKPEAGRRGITVFVKPDGKINVPLMGEVFVAGKTVREIEKSLLRAASKYYSEATIAVDIIEYNSQRFYVFGQVASPGPRPWSGHDTLLDALAAAQPTERAWPERIMVIRGDSPQEGGRRDEKGTWKYFFLGERYETKDRPRKKMVVNLNAMIHSGDLSNNILLRPNDVIFVQPNPFAKVGLALQQIFFPVSVFRGGVTDIRSIVDKNYSDNVFINDSGQ